MIQDCSINALHKLFAIIYEINLKKTHAHIFQCMAIDYKDPFCSFLGDATDSTCEGFATGVFARTKSEICPGIDPLSINALLEKLSEKVGVGDIETDSAVSNTAGGGGSQVYTTVK